MRSLLALILALTATVTASQDIQPSANVDPLTAQIVNPPAPPAKPAPYTELETLRIQNIALEGQIVQRALQDWQAKVAKLKAELEAARPGLTWNPETGAWSATEKPK